MKRKNSYTNSPKR